MALLDDAMFDPAAYAPQGMPPGMLAQMLAAQGGQGAPAPSAGFPMPPAMSSGDGGAMMPLPQPPAPDLPPPVGVEALPAPAAPADARADVTGSSSRSASPDIPDSSLLGRLGDFLKKGNDWRENHRSTLMALGAGLAGAPSIGAGLGRGMALALPAQQHDMAQERQNQTEVALVRRGLPPDVARAAVNNPAIMQQIIPSLFGSKQREFTQIGEDMLGNKQYGFVDKVAGRVWDLHGKEMGAGGGGGLTVPNGPDGQPLSGQALLAHLEKNDPVTAAGIKSLLEGQANPSARNLQKLAPIASLVDPSFDATQYPVRLATRKSYTSGKDFQETQALNTVSGHMARLMKAADGLDNSEWKPINRVKNWVSDTFTGSPALTKFRNDLVTTQNELAKAYHGGHVSDSAFAAFNKSINEAQTPAELKASIGELAGLLQSKIEAKESGYRSSMGDAPLPSEFKATNDEARHAFQSIRDWSMGMKPTAASGAPAAPVAGQPTAGGVPPSGKYVWTPDRGLIPAH